MRRQTPYARSAAAWLPAGALVLWLLFAAAPALARFAGQPYATLRTDHFVIHYPVGAWSFAVDSARIAEQVHQELKPFLKGDEAVTHILIEDDTDSANGSASVVPYNVMVLKAAPPGNDSVLNDHDGWLYSLIAHEYAHILHLNIVGGVPALINAVFGKTYMPNQMQPRWMIEGIAVAVESDYTPGGRNRSSLFDMYIRTAVLENNLRGLDIVSNQTMRFPHGTLWYLYGGRFVGNVVHKYGADRFVAMAREYGSNLIPWSLNTAARNHIGKDLLDLWEEWEALQVREYRTQIKSIEAGGVVEGRRVTHLGQYVGRPRWLSESALIYHASMADHFPQIRLLDLNHHRDSEWKEVLGIQSLAAGWQGGWAAWAAPEVDFEYNAFNDLWRARLDDPRRHVERLTRGERVQFVDISPDGRDYALVRMKTGSMELALCRDGCASATVLVRAEPSRIMDAPRFSPDGKSIVYSSWISGGQRDLFVHHLDSGATEQLTHDRALDTDPVFSPDGRSIWFSSDRTGVFNLYRMDLKSRKTRQVTNVRTGAFQPEPSPDGRRVMYQGFHLNGHDLYLLDLPVEERPAPPSYERPEAPHAAPEVRMQAEDYSPWETLRPFNWFPRYAVSGSESLLGLSVSGSDILGRHSWGLGAAWSFTWDNVVFDAGYTFRQLYTPLFFSVGRRFRDVNNVLFRNGRGAGHREEYWNGDAGLIIPFSRLRMGHSLTLAWEWEYFRALEPRFFDNPFELRPVLPETGLATHARLSWGFSQVERYIESVSVEKGRSLGVTFRVTRPELGGDFSATRVSFGYSEYLPIRAFRRHTLLLQFNGGLGAGELLRRRLFFIGGVPPQDLLLDFVEGRLIQGADLRGYPPGALSGESFLRTTAEYRFPILQMEGGFGVLPFFFRRLHGAVFTDMGDAWFGPLNAMRPRISMGTEVRAELTFGYYQGATLRFGWAAGLGPQQPSDMYLVLGTPF